MGAVKSAALDAAVTFLWVMCVSALGAASATVSAALHVEGFVPSLAVTLVLFTLLLFVFSVLSQALGGASFNPTGIAAMFAAGVSKDNLFSLAIRFPAQAAGAVGGALAIVELMPAQYKHTLGGPSLKVDIHTGAIAEGVLTFIITFAALLIIIKGPRNILIKNWLLAVVTIVLVITGAKYTGPAMNPANAFGWAYVNNRHNTWEQFYIYWICPFIGAILAAWIFKALFLRQAPAKVKKA